MNFQSRFTVLAVAGLVICAIQAIDPDPTLNSAYEKLRKRLDEKGRASLKAEELDWLQWRDAMADEDTRNGVGAQRAGLLKARAEQ